MDEEPSQNSRQASFSSEVTPPLSTKGDADEATSLSVPVFKTSLQELFAENVLAKCFRVAVEGLQRPIPLDAYPEYVSEASDGRYTHREADFWTCGCFPGSLYALLERSTKYPQLLGLSDLDRDEVQAKLLKLCRTYAEPLHGMATRTDTHDMAFIILPALRIDYELLGSQRSLRSVLTAAESLASRYDERVGAIRSWDVAVNKQYSFTDVNEDFLVIIDSMCNLDLLYYASHHTNNPNLTTIATTHAQTVLRTLLRPDHSTYHLLVFDPPSGKVKHRLTNQGYANWSTWSRGQAWAILGFAQTYGWTKDVTFLRAAMKLADYFLGRLAEARHAFGAVPAWDFDAPTPSGEEVLRDVSAGMIAANGMLLIHQFLQLHPDMAPTTTDKPSYLTSALEIVSQTTQFALGANAEFVRPVEEAEEEKKEERLKVRDVEPGRRWDAILRHSTANYNEFANKRYWNHGLVYADYYFLEFGNRLARMGLV